ncbi:putative GNAT family acetyltransferase [Rhizomicrobium palustre]|uniref:Putative GNAT family acetyltransferase n=1 Tax=Rhizomicrobium palustre TaxID=189966 RepID=A0A846MUL6_9PROT|nr:GNAT family N-acetyltransferase [Rhizomicrobium palustre]NIK87053.1 putative GNAT family acetyltransferase [Rhizomicrobium palustre]
MHPLDRPIWNSLTTTHAGFSEGGARAKCYVPDVNVFAGAVDESPEALAALAELVAAGRQVYLLQVPEIVVPEGLVEAKRARGVQMVAARDLENIPQTDIVALGEDDAAEMLELALLTEPGPFLQRTHLMGAFLGIRIDGRLAAMAGERFRFPGFTEVSGVCTHPDFRGHGLAHKLSAVVAAKIAARGETPFLHAWASNSAAIRLYESLGFAIRAEVDVAVLERA